MKSLIEVIQRIGPTAASVMITGESGTGKEKVARALHEASGLTGPFLAVNCAAIPKDLIEAELFGAEKGAFTGAGAVRQGLVELAPGGTLFLDEIGELEVSLQPKLLRFLETRKARRIGGKEEYAVDVRVLAATNRNLEEDIERNLFRLDLYYRLAEVVLKLPALRHHRDDIPLLANYFLQEANEKFGKNILSLEPGLVARLMDYAWPGNVRELRSVIHRLVILYSGPVLRLEWWTPRKPSCATRFPRPRLHLLSMTLALNQRFRSIASNGGNARVNSSMKAATTKPGSPRNSASIPPPFSAGSKRAASSAII